MFSFTNDDCLTALEQPSLFKRDSSQIFGDLSLQEPQDAMPLPSDEGLTWLAEGAKLDIFEDLDFKPLEFGLLDMPSDTPMEGTTESHHLDSQSSTTPDSNPIQIDTILPSAKTFVPPAEVPKAPKRKNKKKDPSRTWDNFRVKRDCFRTFSNYYKNSFKKWNKVWQNEKRNKKKKMDMDEIVKRFCQEQFPSASGEAIELLVPKMMLILHSHRYLKKDSFLQGLDFSQIRGLIYTYSREAKERFMADPLMAFLFHHFSTRAESNSQVELKVKSSLYVLEVENEMEALTAEAHRTLQQSSGLIA